MEKTKVTKIMILEAIRMVAENGADFGEEVSTDDVIGYVDKTVGQLEAKATKAKEKAAEKRAVGDELRQAIAGFLTDELQTAEDIVAKIDDEEVTKAKVVARLTQLINVGKARKEQIKVGERKVMGYALASDDDVEESAE